MNETEQSEFEVLASEFKEFNSKMKDPLVVGALLNKLSEDRQSTNLLFKQILEKLDKIATAFEETSRVSDAGNFQNAVLQTAPVLLAKVDESISAFVKKQGKVSAQIVAEKFKYRGKNAASARLNRLVDKGLLVKQQVGKEVFFLSK